MFRLDQKIAVITGGASGIGKAICESLSEAGAEIFLLDRDRENGEALVRQLQPAVAEFCFCDVTDSGQVNTIFNSISAKKGHIDILINNAGIPHIGTIENTTEADFDKVMGVNVKGVYLCLQAAIPLLKKAGGGAIVNISSIAAELGLPDRFAYSASKGAVQAMTYSVARDFLKDNIRCNAVAPARIHTPFVDGFISRNYPGKEEEMFRKLAATQPIGRMGNPREVANLVLYLCSEEATFITGTVFPIDGGFIRLNT